MHIEKVKISGGDYTRQADHNERKHIYYKSNITGASWLNEVIIPYRQESELIDYAKSQGVTRIRKDAVGALNVVVTLPADEEIDRTDSDYLREWACNIIQGVLKALNLDERDLLGAVIHLDETTPHLHFSVMPIVRTPEGARLSAKDIVTRERLLGLHDEVANYMFARGYTGTYVNDDEKRGLGKVSLEEYKRAQEALNNAENERRRILAEVEQGKRALTDIFATLLEAEKRISEVFREIEAANYALDQARVAELETYLQESTNELENIITNSYVNYDYDR